VIRRPEIYLRNIVRRWKRELQKPAGRVFILSPYLTSQTADTVIETAGPRNCKIYTVFSAENFAAGASSLRTLERLLHAGFSLYHLPDLHAKIVLVPGRFASIGSQNLTHGGTINREATVVLTDPTVIRSLEKTLAPWLQKAHLITATHVDEMKAMLPLLTRKFHKLRRTAVGVDQFVRAKVSQRDEQGLRRLKLRLAKLPAAGSEVVTRVTLLGDTSWKSHSLTRSLVPSLGGNLTRWTIDDEVVRLEKITRYICVNEDSGKFGWARVAKTRITFVADRLSDLSVRLDKWDCKVSLLSLWKRNYPSGVNLKIKLSPAQTSKVLTITAWFGLEELAIVTMTWNRASRQTQRLGQWIVDHRSTFDDQMLQLLLEPFQYREHLFGVQADTFFGSVGTRYRLRLCKVSGKPVLVAKQVH
jgi:hypothetical protein